MTIADVARIVVRRWRVVVVLVVVCLALGAVAWVLVPKSYTASTTLVVSPLNNDPMGGSGSSEEVNIRTEQEILGSSEVARRAATALGVNLSPDSYLLRQTEVAAPSGSQILQVSVTTKDPQQSAKAANALADAYLSFRSDGAKTVAQRYMDVLDKRLRSLDPNDDKALIASLEEQRQNLSMLGSDPGRIIGRAQAPKHPSTPGILVFSAAGAAAGLLIGLFASLIRERSDRRIRSVDRLRFDAITASGVADLEAWRWVLLALEQVIDAHGTSRIAVYAAPPLSPDDVDQALLYALRAHGVGAKALIPDEPLTKAIDHGWPGLTKPSGEDVETVNLSTATSLAQISEVSAEVDAAVVLLAPQSMTSASEVVDVMAEGERHQPRVVFVDPKIRSTTASRSRGHEHRKTRAADADSGARSGGVSSTNRAVGVDGQAPSVVSSQS